MQGNILPLLGPDHGMEKAISNSANYGSRLSTVYPSTNVGWLAWDWKAKQTSQNQKK